MRRLVRPLWLVTRNSAASSDCRCVNYRRADEQLADRRAPTATAVCGGEWRRARICVCGSVRFRPEQICAVTDSVSEQQRSVRSISSHWLLLQLHLKQKAQLSDRHCVMCYVGWKLDTLYKKLRLGVTPRSLVPVACFMMCLTILIELYDLGYRHGQSQDHSMYHAIITSCGTNYTVHYEYPKSTSR